MSRLQIVCPECTFWATFNQLDSLRAAEVLANHRSEFHASAYMYEEAAK